MIGCRVKKIGKCSELFFGKVDEKMWCGQLPFIVARNGIPWRNINGWQSTDYQSVLLLTGTSHDLAAHLPVAVAVNVAAFARR